jgi:AraC-like DNA-binding protein
MNDKNFKHSRKEAILILAMLALTVGGLYASALLSKVSAPLLSANDSSYSWTAFPNSDQSVGGTSELVVNDVSSIINFDFVIPAEVALPWISLTLAFDDLGSPQKYVDWSRYKTLSLSMMCTPSNVLSFAFYTYEESLTQAGDFSTFRNAGVFEKCSEGRQKVVIDLKHLITPDWWLIQHDLHLSHPKYRLDKVIGFAIHNSSQSPREVSSNVTIYSAVLEGRDWRYLYFTSLLAVFVWAGVLFRVARKRSQKRIEEIILRVKEEAKKEQFFTHYQQLPEVARQDKNKSKEAILSYIATAYANPELNIETVASATGANRAKINEFLKNEYGFTFSTCLNKLRLAEAARLLQNPNSSVADVADAVGYGSPSYFITLFKKEYGCTPSSLKKNNEKKLS